MASFLVVLLSIVAFILETLPILTTVHSSVNESATCFGSVQAQSSVKLMSPNRTLEVIDWLCTVFFTIEVLIRFVFAPSKFEFMTCALNIIDILALLPLYMQIALTVSDPQHCLRSHYIVIETIFILRIIRVFRIFHLVKHYRALKILILAIKASFDELLMLAIFFSVAVLLFSTMAFYAERRTFDEDNDVISTIPLGFWWAVVTLTTVGYGDIVPKSTMGSFIAGVCAVSGILLISLVVPILSNNFALFYQHARTQERMKNREAENE